MWKDSTKVWPGWPSLIKYPIYLLPLSDTTNVWWIHPWRLELDMDSKNIFFYFSQMCHLNIFSQFVGINLSRMPSNLKMSLKSIQRFKSWLSQLRMRLMKMKNLRWLPWVDQRAAQEESDGRELKWREFFDILIQDFDFSKLRRVWSGCSIFSKTLEISIGDFHFFNSKKMITDFDFF